MYLFFLSNFPAPHISSLFSSRLQNSNHGSFFIDFLLILHTSLILLAIHDSFSFIFILIIIIIGVFLKLI